MRLSDPSPDRRDMTWWGRGNCFHRCRRLYDCRPRRIDSQQWSAHGIRAGIDRRTAARARADPEALPIEVCAHRCHACGTLGRVDNCKVGVRYKRPTTKEAGVASDVPREEPLRSGAGGDGWFSGRFTAKHRCLVGEKTIPGPPLRHVGGSLNNQECARRSLERTRSAPSLVSGATAISYGCAMLYGNRRCDRWSGMPSALCPDAAAAGAGQLSVSAETEESAIRRRNSDSSISGRHTSFAWGVPCIDASTTGDFVWKGTNTPARRLEARAKS